MSLDRVVIHVSGDKDHAPGLLYVAVSRARSLEGLMFEEAFSFQRLRSNMKSKVVEARAKDATRRRRQLVTVQDTVFS